MTGSRGSLLLLAAIAGASAIFVATTDGIDARVWGVPVRSRSWERPAIVAMVLTGAAGLQFRHELMVLVLRAPAPIVARARAFIGPLPAITACAAGVLALAFGTWAAGGADSYGYVSQAELLAAGRLTDSMPRSRAFAWPSVPYTLTPLGYKEGVQRGTLAPIYPPGFPLLMAPFAAIDRRAGFLVVPLCAAMAVWLCSRIGRERVHHCDAAQRQHSLLRGAPHSAMGQAGSGGARPGSCGAARGWPHALCHP